MNLNYVVLYFPNELTTKTERDVQWIPHSNKDILTILLTYAGQFIF